MWHWASRNATEERRAELLDALRPPAAPKAVAGPVVHHPGLAPPNIRRPSWYKGDQSAFRASVQAAKDHGLRPEPVN